MGKRRSYSFARFSGAIARATGQSSAFVVACLVVLAWAVTGPMFHFSDTWQLVINTGTTIVTFLMVFLIQNTQNRDTEAMHIKMNEIIRSVRGAHNALLCLEELDEVELGLIRARYAELAERARDAVRHGGRDTGTPTVEFMDVDPTKGGKDDVSGDEPGSVDGGSRP